MGLWNLGLNIEKQVKRWLQMAKKENWKDKEDSMVQ